MSPIEDNSPVIIGRVNGLHGVRGGLKIYSYTRPRDQIFNYQPWLIRVGEAWVEHTISASQASGKGLVVTLTGIDDRDMANALVGRDIAIYRHQLAALAAGEYYWHDLVGLEVVDLQGKSLGRVVDMQETGANDVMVVAGADRHLIPWVVDEVIKAVDLQNGRITVDWNVEYL